MRATRGFLPVVVAMCIAAISARPSTADQAKASDAPGPAPQTYTLADTISDLAQRTTLAFDGLGMITGNLQAQSFFPPGKVSDYTGFQYLRDNDPSNGGHNTDFTTVIGFNMLNILSDAQLAQLQALATAQQDQINDYAYERYPLMQAFRRLLTGDIPAGSTGLSLDAVKQASHDLYLIDGQMAFDRALLYANVYNSMTADQKAFLDSMKGKGSGSWPVLTQDQLNAINQMLQALPKGVAVAMMTYAGDIFSWCEGSLDADVYFCPERHGTYYGGFYIKDGPGVGQADYSISETLTATAGTALCDSTQGYVTADQAALVSSLVDIQRNNLYAGATSIVGVRTQIATLLRSLLVSTASSASVNAQVLALSGTYGDLDGEDNYNYVTVFTQLYKTLTLAQLTNLAALRKSILSGTYSDGTPFDDSVCTTYFLYSDPITDTSVLDPYIDNTDYLFTSGTPPTASFSLTSDVGVTGGTLPADYTCDGSGASPEMAWSNRPAGTQGFALLMTTATSDGTMKWNWVLYDIPGTTSSLATSTTGVGIAGVGSDSPTPGYDPPCSQGPGPMLYTFTVYALSGSPQLPADPTQVTGAVLTQAISGITLGSASLTLSYTRPASLLAAAFTFSPSTPSAGQAVTFTDFSTGSPTSWSWTFGDGATSTDESPTHAYSAAGTYTVTLTVASQAGQSSVSHPVVVSSSFARWLPSVSHVQGANGTQWRSDVALLNTGSTTANVQELLYTTAGILQATATVPAGNQVVVTDLAGTFGLNGSGALEVTSDQPLEVTARSYNQVSSTASCYAGGTQGQDYPAVTSSNGLSAGQSAYLAGLTEDTSSRCNIGVVNTGTASATVLVTLYDGAGNDLAGYTVSLAAGQWSQATQPFLNQAHQTAMATGYATVAVQTGSGVFAFASVIDNITNDPTTVSMQQSASALVRWVPVTSHASGLNDSEWRSDLGLLNPGTATANVQIQFYGSSTASTTVTVPAGTQSILTDVVGRLGGTGSGALEVTSDQPLEVTARSYNQVSSTASCYAGGTQGQDYPAVTSSSGLSTGQSAYLAGLTEDTSSRCNIGVVNTGTASATVLVTLYDGAGNDLAGYTVSLAAGQWSQATQPFLNQAHQTAMATGYATVAVQTGSGVFAFASVIDNITNDPTTVSMVAQ